MIDSVLTVDRECLIVTAIYILVDGVLTDWNAWQTCTVTCGGGTQQRSRSCYHPKGKPIGKDCVGDTTETQTCATDYCPGNSL